MKRSTFLLTACLAVAAPAVLAQGPAYPSKPVKIVVGYPPGAASDIVARLVAQELQALNNQGFIVENRPGVGGMLGMSVVAKAPADGYTLGLGVSGTLTTGGDNTSTTYFGVISGGLIGLLGGPAGALIGSVAGAATGAASASVIVSSSSSAINFGSSRPNRPRPFCGISLPSSEIRRLLMS